MAGDDRRPTVEVSSVTRPRGYRQHSSEARRRQNLGEGQNRKFF